MRVSPRCAAILIGVGIAAVVASALAVSNPLAATPTKGVITTVAGGGGPGDGGPPTHAILGSAASGTVGPTQLAFDAAGDLFIADSAGHRVREVTPGADKVIGAPGDSDDVITTIAGNGTYDQPFNGDGGPATSATLTDPEGVAVDAAGDLYIADATRDRVRFVCRAPAGCPATSVGPIAADTIVTVVGTGAPCANASSVQAPCGDGGPALRTQVTSPEGLAVDANGNLYVADRGDHRIRFLCNQPSCGVAGTTISAGQITTVAGHGVICLTSTCGDGGPATAAPVSLPDGVAVDPGGRLFISSLDHRVREVATDGTISTVAGDGSCTDVCQPVQLAIDAAAGSEKLYVANSANLHNDILEVDLSTSPPSKPVVVAGSALACGGGACGDGGAATAASMTTPMGVAVDAAHILFVADSGVATSRVRRVVPGSVITTAAGLVTSSAVADGDGAAATQATLSLVRSSAGLAADAAGDLYIADPGDNTVRFVCAPASSGCTLPGGSPLGAGSIATLAGTGTPGFSGDGGAAVAAELNSPQWVALDAAGNVYISDRGNNRVRFVCTQVSGCTALGGATVGRGAIATVAGSASQCADSTTACGDGGPATSAQLSGPSGLAVVGATLYVADSLDQRVRRIDGCGTITTVAGTGLPGAITPGVPASQSMLSNPLGIAVDPAGTLYVADAGNSDIAEVGAAGSISDLTAAASPFTDVQGVAVDAQGNLYIGDSGDNLIQVLCKQTSCTRTGAQLVTVGTNQGFIAAGGGTAGYFGDGGSAAVSSGMSGPSGIALDAMGNAYIADVGNDRIRMVTTPLAGTGPGVAAQPPAPSCGTSGASTSSSTSSAAATSSSAVPATTDSSASPPVPTTADAGPSASESSTPGGISGVQVAPGHPQFGPAGTSTAAGRPAAGLLSVLPPFLGRPAEVVAGQKPTSLVPSATTKATPSSSPTPGSGEVPFPPIDLNGSAASTPAAAWWMVVAAFIVGGLLSCAATLLIQRRPPRPSSVSPAPPPTEPPTEPPAEASSQQILRPR